MPTELRSNRDLSARARRARPCPAETAGGRQRCPSPTPTRTPARVHCNRRQTTMGPRVDRPSLPPARWPGRPLDLLPDEEVLKASPGSGSPGTDSSKPPPVRPAGARPRTLRFRAGRPEVRAFPFRFPQDFAMSPATCGHHSAASPGLTLPAAQSACSSSSLVGRTSGHGPGLPVLRAGISRLRGTLFRGAVRRCGDQRLRRCTMNRTAHEPTIHRDRNALSYAVRSHSRP